MTYATLADGSPLPDFRTQSPRTPFSVGKLQTLGNILYGYSGTINYTISAEPSLPMINFSLEHNAIMKFKFSADYDFAGAAVSIGYRIALDGTTIYEWRRFGGTNGEGAYMPEVLEIIVPAGRNCLVTLLNDAVSPSAGLPQATMNIIGQYV